MAIGGNRQSGIKLCASPVEATYRRVPVSLVFEGDDRDPLIIAELNMVLVRGMDEEPLVCIL